MQAASSATVCLLLPLAGPSARQEVVVTAADALGAADAAPGGGIGLGALFQRAAPSSQLGSRAEVYALRGRAGVLAQLEAPPLVLHAAEAEKKRFPFEARGGCGCAVPVSCQRQTPPSRPCPPAGQGGGGASVASRQGCAALGPTFPLPPPPPAPTHTKTTSCRPSSAPSTACSWTRRRTSTCSAWRCGGRRLCTGGQGGWGDTGGQHAGAWRLRGYCCVHAWLIWVRVFVVYWLGGLGARTGLSLA
jgi:hypothetical protein